MIIKALQILVSVVRHVHACGQMQAIQVSRHILATLSPQSPDSLGAQTARPWRICCVYAQADQQHWQELRKHLEPLRRQRVIDALQERCLGQERAASHDCDEALGSVDLVVIFLTPDLLALSYCYGQALRRLLRGEGGAALFPVLLRPTGWDTSPFAGLALVPRDGRSLTCWESRDAGWVHVVHELRQALGDRGRRL